MSDEVKDRTPIVHLDHIVEVTSNNEKTSKRRFGCSALAFSSNGEKLYGGFTDGNIKVWEIV